MIGRVFFEMLLSFCVFQILIDRSCSLWFESCCRGQLMIYVHCYCTL